MRVSREPNKHPAHRKIEQYFSSTEPHPLAVLASLFFISIWMMINPAQKRRAKAG